MLAAASADPNGLDLTGPEQVLPSVFDVTALATASIAAAQLAAGRPAGGARRLAVP